MSFAKDDLIEALRLRYDYYSASSVFELARQRAGLDDKPAFDAGELRAFRGALAAVGDRVGTVLEQLDGWLDAPAPAPAPVVAQKPVEKAPDKAPDKVADKVPDKFDKLVEKVADKADKSDRIERSDKKKPKGGGAASFETTIVLTGVPVAEGEQVLVCGGGDDLGDWDPARARPMSKKGGEWSTTVKLAADAEVPFKFLRRTASGQVIWEGGEDRYLVAKPRVEATWRAEDRAD